MCVQRRLRSACACAQADQSLRRALCAYPRIQSVLRRTVKTLIYPCRCEQIDLCLRWAHMETCRKCCVPVHMYYCFCYFLHYVLVCCSHTNYLFINHKHVANTIYLILLHTIKYKAGKCKELIRFINSMNL